MGPVSTPASTRRSVMPTLSRSRLTRAEKHPWALRYAGQIPGWRTNVASPGLVKISGSRMSLAGAVAERHDAHEIERGSGPRGEPLGVDPVLLMTQERHSRQAVVLRHVGPPPPRIGLRTRAPPAPTNGALPPAAVR